VSRSVKKTLLFTSVVTVNTAIFRYIAMYYFKLDNCTFVVLVLQV